MSTNKPTLSIVTATLGKFTDDWLSQLLNIKGSVEFILVYPPGIKYRDINDPRIKFITSPYKGEVMQRFTGLLNAQGEYVVALDDDDFMHPDVLQLVNQYFQIFPESWVLRLMSINIQTQDVERTKEPWGEIPDLSLLDLETKNADASYSFNSNPSQKILELPIAPVDKKFDIRYAIWPFMKRTDHKGRHLENFNTKVWKNELVQNAIPAFSQATKLWEMKMAGALAWIPSWNLDRSLCLFIQAELYEKDKVIGHWMPKPEQVRFLEKPFVTKEPRILLAADALLVKKFPQYGYFWNLFFYQVYTLPKTFAKAIKMSLSKSVVKH